MFQQITFTLPYLQWASVCFSRNGKKLLCMEKLNFRASHWYALIYFTWLCSIICFWFFSDVSLSLYLLCFLMCESHKDCVFEFVYMPALYFLFYFVSLSCLPFSDHNFTRVFPTLSYLCNYTQSFPFLVVRVSYFLCICHHSVVSCTCLLDFLSLDSVENAWCGILWV